MADNNNSAGNIIETLLKGMDSVLATKTVVGEATHIGDTIILPLVDVTFGVGAGASFGGEKKNGGGGGGISGKMSPSAILVIKDGSTKLVNVKNQDTMTKVLDMVPDVVDKITSLIGKNKTEMPSDEDVKKAAFPTDEE